MTEQDEKRKKERKERELEQENKKKQMAKAAEHYKGIEEGVLQKLEIKRHEKREKEQLQREREEKGRGHSDSGGGGSSKVKVEGKPQTVEGQYYDLKEKIETIKRCEKHWEDNRSQKQGLSKWKADIETYRLQMKTGQDIENHYGIKAPKNHWLNTQGEKDRVKADYMDRLDGKLGDLKKETGMDEKQKLAGVVREEDPEHPFVKKMDARKELHEDRLKEIQDRVQKRIADMREKTEQDYDKDHEQNFGRIR